MFCATRQEQSPPPRHTRRRSRGSRRAPPCGREAWRTAARTDTPPPATPAPPPAAPPPPRTAPRTSPATAARPHPRGAQVVAPRNGRGPRHTRRRAAAARCPRQCRRGSCARPWPPGRAARAGPRSRCRPAARATGHHGPPPPWPAPGPIRGEHRVTCLVSTNHSPPGPRSDWTPVSGRAGGCRCPRRGG